MKLTQQQQDSVIKKLSPFLEKMECSTCHNKSFLINDTIYEVREFLGGSLTLGGKTTLIPLVSIMCEKCSEIRFFNAILLGVINPKDFKNEADNKEPKK